MKKLFAAIALSVVATAAYASCTTQTIIVDGRVTTCTSCCDSWGNCTVTCF